MELFQPNDDVMSLLRAAGYVGTYNDMMFAYLGDLGYVGSLADRFAQMQDADWPPP